MNHPLSDALVLFGATGDLAHKKIYPALQALLRRGHLDVPVVGVARSNWDLARLRERVRDSLAQHGASDSQAVEKLCAQLRYIDGDYKDPTTFARLGKELGSARQPLHYLAIPPSMFPTVVKGLAALESTRGARVVVEKPFGRDLASAQALNATLHQVFPEERIFRIDHYLGKETVQNILVFRFANGIWEPIWNRRYIDSVQITVAETLGVGSRAGYYEEAGALRDMVANHMMQLVTLMCMEPPVDFGADSVRDEKVKVLRAVERMDQSLPDNLIRGQYVAGWSGGQPVKGYHEEDGVAPDSSTETYVALKLSVDNWRWAGVPFYLRHGKRLPKRTTEIAIQFKMPPRQLFAGVAQGDLIPNTLVLRIQPGDGIGLRILAKGPGASIQLRPVTMDFLYGTSFDADVPEAYERLVLDCLLGDSTLFARRDEVETTWAIFDGVLRKEQSDQLPCQPYEAGSWGPAAADELIERDGRHWRRL